MKFVGKTLQEYGTVGWKFFALVFFLQVMSTIWRVSGRDPSIMQNLLGLIVIILILVGWAVVRKHRFSLQQTAFMGFLLSFGTHWALPIFHNAGAVVYFFLVNSVLFSIITAFGGLIGKMSRFQN